MNIVIRRNFGEYAVVLNGIIIALGTLAKCQEVVRTMA